MGTGGQRKTMKKFSLFLIVMLTCIQVVAFDVSYNELTMQPGQNLKIRLPYPRYDSLICSNRSVAHAFYRVETAGYLYIYAISRGSCVIDLERDFERVIYNIKVLDVADITLPNNLCLIKGESYTYSPIIHDIGATTTLTWQSTDPQVATVTEEGALKAVSEGKITIICTAANGVTAQSLVEVKPVKVESVALDESEIELAVGGQKQLVATITPDTANKSVWWSSSNKSVAFVDENGIVTGAAPGYCLISGYAADGIGEKASCLVHVKGDGSGVYKEMGAGDVNSDGSVDVADIATIIRAVAAKGQAAKVGMNE